MLKVLVWTGALSGYTPLIFTFLLVRINCQTELDIEPIRGYGDWPAALVRKRWWCLLQKKAGHYCVSALAALY